MRLYNVLIYLNMRDLRAHKRGAALNLDSNEAQNLGENIASVITPTLREKIRTFAWRSFVSTSFSERAQI